MPASVGKPGAELRQQLGLEHGPWKGRARGGAHVRFILNSSFWSWFMTKVKGGSWWLLRWAGIGRVPTQSWMYHLPKSWEGTAS